jgi:amino acid transporter
MATDFRSIGKFEQGAMVAGAIAIILSFFESYVTVSAGPISAGTNAWDSWATLGVLLLIVATAVIAIKAFAKENLPDNVPWSLVATAAAGLGTILLILRAFTYSDGGLGSQVDIGPGWSGWVLFIAGIALTVFAFLSYRESGEKLPQANNRGGHTPPPAPPAA